MLSICNFLLVFFLFCFVLFFPILLISTELPHPSQKASAVKHLIWPEQFCFAFSTHDWSNQICHLWHRTSKAGRGRRSCRNYCQVFARPLRFYPSPSHKDVYPEIKDPSAFLWELSWRQEGWLGILRRLWMLCGEPVSCLCKNVSVRAEEFFSSSLAFSRIPA